MAGVGNEDSRAAVEYHDATKHSVARLRASRHVLDWDNHPLPYKLYRDLEPIELPRDWPPLAEPTLQAVAAVEPQPGRAAIPSLTALARWLLLSAGITRKVVYANGRENYFRAAACTGALYHIDVYLVCGPLPGLEAGVYHFGAHDFALRRLRAGDHRALVTRASGGEPAIAAAPVVAVYASTFWRNAWKYQARTYRHCFWDCGTILANALAVAAADQVPMRVVLGFVDGTINHLLGLDPEREAALALVALGHDPGRPLDSGVAEPAPAAEPPRLELATEPLSAREVDHPAIRTVHAASSLASPSEVRAWRSEAARLATPPPSKPDTVPTGPSRSIRSAGLERTIRRRGSTRRFSPAAIDGDALTVLLAASAAPIPTDVAEASRTDAYVIVHAIDGLEPGAYVYDPGARRLECLRTGDFRREAGFLGLGQDLPAEASVNVYWLVDLERALTRMGNRGYRAAQLDAAIRGGRLYLGAYALGLGASGLTFFDDDVTAFFSPHAAGKSVMFLVAVGHGYTKRQQEGA